MKKKTCGTPVGSLSLPIAYEVDNFLHVCIRVLNVCSYRNRAVRFDQGYRDTGIPGYRDTGIQYRDTRIQGYRETGIQDTRIQGKGIQCIGHGRVFLAPAGDL